MKIAIFHELTLLSGARKVVEEYGKILRKNHQVDLYYVDSLEDKNVKDVFTNVHFFKFVEKEWKGGNWRARIYKDTVELIKLYILHKQIASLIKKEKYNLILINPSKFTQAPFLLGLVKDSVYYCQEPLRLVYDERFKIDQNLNIINQAYEQVNRKLRQVIDRKNIKNVKKVLANSNYSKDRINKSYGINAKVCYLGVDTQKFKPLNLKKTQDILFVGERNSIEGFDLLKSTLKLFKIKPVVKFIERDRLGKGISEKELIKEYNKSKIVVALSKGEPFGLLPLEAMACEVPVIAVSEGGLKESLTDGKTGYLIDRDEHELKDKIDLLLNNSELRNKIGKAGRAHVLSKFTWSGSVNRFLKIIENKGYLSN